MLLLTVLAVGGLAILGVVVTTRWIESISWRRHLMTFRFELPRGLTQEQVGNWLAALGASTRHIPAAIEIEATQDGIRHYLYAPQRHANLLLTQARDLLPGVRLELCEDEQTTRVPRAAGELRLTSTSHPLGQERAAAASAALLSTLHPLSPDQTIRLVWLLAGTTTPHPAGLVRLAPDLARFRRLKQRAPLIRACGRISVSADSPRIARALLYRVYSALRVLDAPGAAVVRRMLPWRLVAGRMRRNGLPLTIWPAIFNTRELAGLLAIPFDGVQAPGITLESARQIPAAPDLPRRGLVLGRSNYPGLEHRPIALRTADRLRHLWLLGPTGVGKSTLIASMALQDARAGYGLIVVDPKSDLISDILARLPESRRKDVIVLDPAATDRPIGFNVLGAAADEHARELLVDNVVRIFAELWKASFGPRTTDVLRNALLTLTATRAVDGSAFTLAEVAPLLENPAFRRFVTAQAAVPESVRSFWAAYEQLSRGEREQTIAPSLNKLRSFTTRTSLRLILGQSTGLDVRAVFTRRRILLASLNKGVVGSETAMLLGALLVSSAWSAALERAALPAKRRRPVWAYLDEFQDVLRMGGDIADALSQARAMGLGLTLAHQYVDQLPPSLQAAVMGTARSSVAFQLDHKDARILEKRYQPSLTADDLTSLRAYEVAARLCADGRIQTPVTMRTTSLSAPIRDPNELLRGSRERYGVPRADVEARLRDRLANGQAQSAQFGRRRGGAA